jgi:ketosteroid isomerase-like protein
MMHARIAWRFALTDPGGSVYKLCVAIGLIAFLATPVPASESAEALSVIRRWVDSFNRGDAQSAIAMCADHAYLVDDFAPYQWNGVHACQDWFGDARALAGSQGVTHEVITLGKTWHIEVKGDLGYVVIPTTLSFLQQGKRAKSRGFLTVTLHKEIDWRMTGWIWSDH